MTTPTDALLADYASGAVSPGIALLIAAHLTHSQSSRSKVAQAETLGGALLDECDAAPLGADALSSVLAQIEAPDAIVPERPRRTGGILPAPVAEAIGCDLADVPWRFRLPGVSEYVLDGYGAEDEKVSLLRARPGATIPQHTHDGRELTLVMSGILLDDGIEYHAGDVAMNTEDDDHKPQVIGSETCHCLIVMDGGLRFTGAFSRAFNLLAE